MRIVVTILIYVLLQNEVKVIRNPNKIWCLFSKNLQISDIIDEGRTKLGPITYAKNFWAFYEHALPPPLEVCL